MVKLSLLLFAGMEEVTKGHTITYKRILEVALPIMLGGLADNFNTVVNTAFVSRLGEVSTGAVGLGGLYYFNFIIIALGLALGHQIIVGRRNGEGNFEEAGRTFMHALQLFAAVGIVLFTIIYFTSDYALGKLVHSANIRLQAEEYIRIRMFGAPLICMSICMRSFYIGITRTRIIVLVTILSAATNIFLDYSLIFGNFGFPKMGIRGAAYASLTAEFVALSAYFIASISLPFLNKYKLYVIRKRSISIWTNILKVGSPMMLQNWISFSSWFLFFILIENIGERALAVSTVIKNIYLFFLIPMWGMASSTNTLTSNLVGEGRTNEVPHLLKKIITFSLVATLILIQPNLWFSSQMISIFNDSPAFVAEAQPLLYIISFALILFCVGMMLYNTVSGLGDTTAAMVIEIFTIACYIAYLVVFTKIFTPDMRVVWASEWMYMGVVGLISFLRLSATQWQHKEV